MNEHTKAEYLKLAAHFYKTRLGSRSPTPKRLCDALKATATSYRPAYWRRLRKAIEVDQRDKGFTKAADSVAATTNPITATPGRRNEIKPKQRRIKQVSEQDENVLLDYLVSNQQVEVYAAVVLTKYLGCRPVELRSLIFDGKDRVFINGAKKRDDRGLDRELIIDDWQIYRHLMLMHQKLLRAHRVDPIRYAQKRLATIVQRLWPQRKARPSLYSFRHQLGADLKASDKSIQEVAAIMGHRSTASVSVYGNRALSRNSLTYLRATPRSIDAVSNRLADLPFSQKNARQRPVIRTQEPTSLQ